MLNEDQQLALKKITTFLMKRNSKDFILEGMAGCGKGYLVRYINSHWDSILEKVKILNGNQEIYLINTATTNEAVGQMGIQSAETIYRSAGIRPIGRDKYQTGGVNNLDNLLVVIDEASYVSSTVYGLIRKQYPNAKILWVMDQYQLAPVGEELPYVSTLGFDQISLKKVERNQGELQALCSLLRNTVMNKTRLSLGQYHNGDSIVVTADLDEFHSLIKSRFTTFPDPKETRYICYRNAVVNDYNQAIDNQIFGNPAFPYVGAKVIVNKYNPKLGWHVGMPTTITSVKDCSHNFSNGTDTTQVDTWTVTAKENIAIIAKEAIPYGFKNHHIEERMVELALPYAMTTHKSQGSTVDTVFVNARDINRCHCSETKRRLLYVAVSRAAKRVVIYV